MARRDETGLVLLLDTCAELASVAVADAAGVLVAQEVLPSRTASTLLLGAIRAVLARAGTSVAELKAIGVVSGPGSFTGVRVGLAFAKGLCEAGNVPLVAVSRLAVLAEVAGGAAVAAISAGRHEVYVRTLEQGRPSERLMTDASLKELEQELGPGELAVDSAELQMRLGLDERLKRFELTAASAIPLVLREIGRSTWHPGLGGDAELVDANYVRDESVIYRRSTTPAEAGGVPG